MRINRKLQIRTFYFLIFLIFFGFYIGLMLISTLGLQNSSRLYSIPIRIAISFGLLVLFFSKNQIPKNKTFYLFIIFSSIYFFRIFSDYYWGNHYLFNTEELIFYFGSFAVLPFFVLSSFRISDTFLKIGKNALLLSAFIFSLLTVINYNKYIGLFVRLTKNRTDEDVLGPIILSYCASLAIGLSVYYLFNERKRLYKWFYLSIIILSSVPFFLAASRGSLFALFIPFLFLVGARKSFKTFIGYFLITAALVFLIIFLAPYFKSGLVDRFLNIISGIESGGEEASAGRLIIWKQSLSQFANHPLFGDKFQVEGFEGYQHNLFVEVLQTTGFMGFIPFLILTLIGISNAIKIFRKTPEYSWVSIIFFQSLVQNSFSGAIFTASWFWTSIALVISTGYYLRSVSNKGLNVHQFNRRL